MGEAKRKNQRACPALGKTISAAECGSGRNSEIDCPADCPHNPFSAVNYIEQFGPLEEKVIHKLTALLSKELSRTEVRELLECEDEYDAHALHVWHIHGRGLFDQWREAGRFDGWKNDERFMAECFATIRVALTEIQRIENETTVVLRDLLQPELGELRLIDTSFVRNAKRYDTHLGWIYQIPAGWRSSGSAISFEGVGYQDPVESFNILVEHLGAPAEDRQKWLLENMILLREAITEVMQARKELSFRASDLREVRRTFHTTAARAKQLITSLSKKPLVDAVPKSKHDFEATVLEASQKGMQAAIGQLTFNGTEIEARAMSMKRADALRDFLVAADPALKMADESVIDYGEEAGFRKRQPELAPPALLKEVGQVELTQHRVPLDPTTGMPVVTEMTSGLMDLPLPLLDGLSPREAAARPELRQALIRLMKGHITRSDEMRRKGLDIDYNPILKELGLDELIQPAPPLGDPQPPEPDASNLPGPPPGSRPIDAEEIDQRITPLFEDKDKLDRGLIRHEELLDAVIALPAGEFSEFELELLRSAANLAILVFHPTLPRDFRPDFDRMTEWYDDILEATNPSGDPHQVAEAMVEATGQALLVKQVTSFVAIVSEKAGKPLRNEHSFEFILAVAALVREIAHWPWKR
ncbi:hypothetical protein [Haloferula sp.]|uniref:hypothetical protein n=1 Tax=Haloferula sp. TaxID=2497595 RepID=UPI003C718D7A